MSGFIVRRKGVVCVVGAQSTCVKRGFVPSNFFTDHEKSIGSKTPKHMCSNPCAFSSAKKKGGVQSTQRKKQPTCLQDREKQKSEQEMR